jgi:hypothetical protein
VKLSCAKGAVLQAHSRVLLARCEYFRRWHSSGLGQGAVDLSEHTAATMACVLQFLCTGRASLQQDKGDAAAQGGSDQVAAPPASSASGGAEGQSSTTGPSTPADLMLQGSSCETLCLTSRAYQIRTLYSLCLWSW